MTYRITLFLLSLSLTLTSCSPIFKTIVGFHDPRVETPESIVEFINKSGCSFSHNYLLKCESDSLSIFKSIAHSGSSEVFVFDGKGRRYCYASNDSISCSGNMLKLVFYHLEENFAPCPNDSTTLGHLFQRFIPIVATDELILQDSSYYLVYYWSKFFGGKRQYKENLMWLKSMQMESPSNITVLMVNTDLQESWGLEPGIRLKVKLRINFHGAAADRDALAQFEEIKKNNEMQAAIE